MAKDDFIGLDQRCTISVKEEDSVPQAKCGSWDQFWGSAGVSAAYVVETTHNARFLKKSGYGIEAKEIYMDDQCLTKDPDEAQRTIAWERGMA